jgi:hypothetical protein
MHLRATSVNILLWRNYRRSYFSKFDFCHICIAVLTSPTSWPFGKLMVQAGHGIFSRENRRSFETSTGCFIRGLNFLLACADCHLTVNAYNTCSSKGEFCHFSWSTAADFECYACHVKRHTRNLVHSSRPCDLCQRICISSISLFLISDVALANRSNCLLGYFRSPRRYSLHILLDRTERLQNLPSITALSS